MATTNLSRQAAGFRFAQTEFGDTIQAVAFRELGDASRWVDIVALNKLRPPYISDTARGDGVILSGDILRVPSATRVIQTVSNPDLVFGIDVRMADDGQLSTTASGDLDTVGGIDNFCQALRDLLATDNGELIFHPEYGCKLRTLIGTINGPTAALLAAAYARDALLTDPRVERVISSDAKVVGDVTTVVAKVQPIVGQAVDVTQVV